MPCSSHLRIHTHTHTHVHTKTVSVVVFRSKAVEGGEGEGGKGQEEGKTTRTHTSRVTFVYPECWSFSWHLGVMHPFVLASPGVWICACGKTASRSWEKGKSKLWRRYFIFAVSLLRWQWLPACGGLLMCHCVNLSLWLWSFDAILLGSVWASNSMM